MLITHEPPYAFGDWTQYAGRVGDAELAHEIKSRIRPKLHVFGHIHESYGACYDPDGRTLYANASSYHARCPNAPIVVDVAVGESSEEHPAMLVAPTELVRCMPAGPDKFIFVA